MSKFRGNKRIKLLASGLLGALLIACGMPDTIVAERTFYTRHVAGHPQVSITQQIISNGILNYASAGRKDKLAVVFLHGTPGNLRNYGRYLIDAELLDRVRVVAVDRPGWGGSSAENKLVESSFQEQVRFLKLLLEKLMQDNNGAGVILVGHSLGASIAPRVAMDYPELVSGMVLMAGSLDPQLGKPRWYNWAASTQPVSWFLSAKMKQANQEIMPLREELQAMQPLWKSIQIPVTVIQGLQDELVHPRNIDFAGQVLENADLALIRLPNAGHFIPWENRDKVMDAILKMIAKIE